MYDDTLSIALYMLAAPDSGRIAQELEHVFGRNKK